MDPNNPANPQNEAAHRIYSLLCVEQDLKNCADPSVVPLGVKGKKKYKGDTCVWLKRGPDIVNLTSTYRQVENLAEKSQNSGKGQNQ